MSEERSDEIHEAIAREMERETREEFFEWLEQNEPDCGESPLEERTESERADWKQKWRETRYDSMRMPNTTSLMLVMQALMTNGR